MPDAHRQRKEGGGETPVRIRKSAGRLQGCPEAERTMWW